MGKTIDLDSRFWRRDEKIIGFRAAEYEWWWWENAYYFCNEVNRVCYIAVYFYYIYDIRMIYEMYSNEYYYTMRDNERKNNCMYILFIMYIDIDIV